MEIVDFIQNVGITAAMCLALWKSNQDMVTKFTKQISEIIQKHESETKSFIEVITRNTETISALKDAVERIMENGNKA